MKISPVLTWKYLSSKVHPPLPLNPRDSQKLLSLLNTSFRKQLDREHPKIRSDERQATDAHINSILRSPLFLGTQKGKPLVSPQHQGPRNDTQTVVQAKASSNDSINSVERFQQLVASGKADLRAAHLCLSDIWTRVKNLPKELQYSEMKTSQAGAVVLHWLWSSGSMQSLLFLHETKFTASLIPFLIVEGRKTLLWKWLRLLSKEAKGTTSNGVSTPVRIDVQSNLIRQFIHCPFNCGGDYNAMIAEFLYVVQEVSSWDYPNEWISAVLGPVGATLTLFLIKQPELSDKTPNFAALVDTAPMWNRKGVYEAILHTRHPKHQDPALALQFLRARGLNHLDLRSRDRVPIIMLCLDTAQLLTRTKHHQEARFVMEFLQTNVAPEIKSQMVKPNASAYQSLWNEYKELRAQYRDDWCLRILDRLAI